MTPTGIIVLRCLIGIVVLAAAIVLIARSGKKADHTEAWAWTAAAAGNFALAAIDGSGFSLNDVGAFTCAFLAGVTWMQVGR